MNRSAAVGIAVCFVVVCSIAGCTQPSRASSSKSSGAIPFVLDKVADRFDGVVVEAVFVDGYVYVGVVDDAGEARQVVSLKKPVAVGDRVHVNAFGKKDGFHSKKLDRDFPSLWFAVVTVTEKAQEKS